MPEEEQSTNVFDQWFYASLGACDLGQITDEKVLDVTYNDFKAQSPANLEVSMEGAGNILAQFGGNQNVADYADTSLLDALRSEGFFSATAQNYKLP